MKLIVVRHAETIENTKRLIQSHNPGTLTKKGKQQAEKLAKRLSKENIDLVYSSDLGRCKDTLAPFLKLKKVPVFYDEDLRERHFGDFTGKTMDDFLDWVRGNGLAWNFSIDIPGGENYQDVLKRTKRFLDKIINKHKGQTVLVMTHGATKVAILLNLFNKPAEKETYLGYRASNTSLSVININDEGNHEAKILNSLDHLE